MVLKIICQNVCTIFAVHCFITVNAVCLLLSYYHLRTEGRYALPVRTVRAYGCLFSTRTRGPSARAVEKKVLLCNAFLLYGPYKRLVHAGSRSYGPYSSRINTRILAHFSCTSPTRARPCSAFCNNYIQGPLCHKFLFSTILCLAKWLIA